MIKVIDVSPGWAPPPDEKFALVEVARSGSAYFMDAVKEIELEDRARLFQTNNDAPDIATAIDRAREWAVKNGASVVYIARAESAPTR